MARFGRVQVLIVGVAMLVAACVQVGPSAAPSRSYPPDPDSGRLHAQAEAALQRWADAVAAAKGATGFVPVGELTGQIGDWEEPVGENNKVALMSGVVDAAVPMPSDEPADRRIRWPDGTSTSVPLISAAAAVDQIRADAVQPCPDCQPLRITAARLTERPFETSRGTAVVPMWAFTVEGTAVEITRVAVGTRVTPVLPPWDENDPPIGIWIDGAVLAADGQTLTVHFVGAPGPASEPCGEDYVAEAVESDLAVVVIVHVYRYSGSETGVGCLAIGAGREATVRLAAPLADRAVLEVREGRAVAVSRATGP